MKPAKPKPTAKPKPKPTPTPSVMDAIDRANREQAREAEEMKRMKAGKKPVGMKSGGKMKKYAKGGSVDGCASKGKTKTKMVKMAMGGLAGRTPAGRSMMMRPETQGGPTRATFKRGGSCGMKKGK